MPDPVIGNEGESNDEFTLGGGPVVPGVDYEPGWLEAHNAAAHLNQVLRCLRLDPLVQAQEGWGDGRECIVRLRCTPMGARRLAWLLDRLPDEPGSGPKGSPA